MLNTNHNNPQRSQAARTPVEPTDAAVPELSTAARSALSQHSTAEVSADGYAPQGGRSKPLTSDRTCPRCGARFDVVGLNWVETGKGDGGYPEERLQLACPTSGCGIRSWEVADPSVLPTWLYIDAAGAEIAVAHVLGIEDYSPDADPPGIVKGLRVRWTCRPAEGLMVYEEDPDDAIIVLVSGGGGSYTVHGCARGGDVKHDRFRAGGAR